MANEIIIQENQEWALLKKQCTAFVMSNLLPRHIYENCKDETQVLAKAMTIALKGKELGLPPLYALSSITVIQGKPALSAELMLSLVLKKYPLANPEFTTTETSCTISLTRPGGKPQSFTFTMDDANAAGLVKPGGAWVKYRRAMLRSRATSEACRSLFPEALLGAIYTQEELGGAIDVEVTQTTQALEEPQEQRSAAESKPILVKVTSDAYVDANQAQVDLTTKQVLVKPSNGNTPSYNERADKRMAELCTEPQRKKFFAMCRNLGWDKDDSKEFLFNKFGKESSSELSKIQIQEAYELMDIEGSNLSPDAAGFLSGSAAK